MRKLLLIILLVLCTFSCGPSKRVKENEPTNFYMKTLVECMYSYSQLDSLCVVDNISSQIPDWNKTMFINGETGEVIEQYLYIVSKKDTTIIYSAIPNKDSVFVIKRIQIEN
jgi:hypothetical protein